MDREEKIVFRYVIFFTVVGGLVGLLSGLFFAFFPGSGFIMAIFGMFMGLIIGFILGTLAKLRAIKSKRDKYKI